MGYLCLAVGACLALIAGGAIPAESAQVDAPRWLLMLMGLNVMACGGSLIAKPESSLHLGCVSLILLSFAVAGGWVAFFSEDDAIAGGLFFLPRSINIILARGLFSLGPVFSLALLGAMLRQTVTNRQK